MSKVLNGEVIMKLTVILSFFVCYSWFYQAMTKDEKSLERMYTQRLATLEKSTGELLTNSAD